MIKVRQDILPIKLLFHKAGIVGYLFLFKQPLSLVTTRQRDAGNYAAVDGAAAISIFYIMICFLYCLSIINKPKGKYILHTLYKTPIVFLLAYILLCTASCSWSPNLKYTAYRGFECLVWLLMIVAVFSELRVKCSRQDIVEWVMLWAVWDIFWAIVVNVRFMGLGYLIYPFTAARLSSGLFFFLALFLCRRKLFKWIVMAFSVLSVSNKNYFGITFGLIPGLIHGERKVKVIMSFLVGLLILGFLSKGMSVIQNALFYGKEGVGMEYTTGRDKIWEMSFDLGLQKPLNGYGFVAGEKDALNDVGRKGVISTHNMLLSAFLGVGISGPILLLCFFAGVTCRCIRTCFPLSWRSGLFGTVIMVFVISNTAPGLGGRVYGSWIPSVLVLTLIVCISEYSKPDFKHNSNTSNRNYLL